MGQNRLRGNEDGTGFDKHPENINKEGRPKGFKGLTGTLESILNTDGTMIIDQVYEVDEQGKETGNIFKKAKVKIPKKEMVILAAIKKAIKGDIRAIEFIFDRIEGKASQPIEVDQKNKTVIEFVNVSKQFNDDGTRKTLAE